MAVAARTALARRREATCSAILDAAASVIAEKGCEGFTISDIAERAGVNRALIYHYFKDRDNLISETIDHVFSRYDDGPNDMSAASLERGIRNLLAHPEFSRFFYQLLLDGRPLLSLGERFKRTLDAVAAHKAAVAPDSPLDTVFGTMTVLLTTLAWAFSREQFARFVDLSPEEADERLIAAVRSWGAYVEHELASAG